MLDYLEGCSFELYGFALKNPKYIGLTFTQMAKQLAYESECNILLLGVQVFGKVWLNPAKFKLRLRKYDILFAIAQDISDLAFLEDANPQEAGLSLLTTLGLKKHASVPALLKHMETDTHEAHGD